MENTKLTLLEKEIEKSVKTRERISKILADNFLLEEDLAALIAEDAVNQAIGTDKIHVYTKLKRRQRVKSALLSSVKATGKAVAYLIPLSIGFLVLFYIVTGMYACATAPDYPRTYTPLPESAKFVDTARNDWKGDKVYGLNNDNNLCVAYYGIQGNGGERGSAKTCIHRNKVQGLNSAMEKAVAEDFNGVVWNEANGNGEIWTVERNNYRFVITANEDPNFKK